MRSVAIRVVNLWAGGGLLALGAWIVLGTRIGPVIAVIDARHGHGVHTGDFLGVASALLALPLVAAGASGAPVFASIR